MMMTMICFTQPDEVINTLCDMCKGRQLVWMESNRGAEERTPRAGPGEGEGGRTVIEAVTMVSSEQIN